MTQPADFTHLHVHTQYSMLDGAIRFNDLFDKCKEYGMDTVTITDHGSMYGALEFYVAAKKAKLKPIIGCEFYVAPVSRHIKKAKAGDTLQYYHLVLLAMNKTGYQNLLKLASIAYMEGFYYKPRIDKEVLAQHSEGLIALTACLHGEVPYLVGHNGDFDGAAKAAKELHKLFPDRLYFEIQENGLQEQIAVNQGLKKLSAQLNIPLVATNDCHYLERSDAYAHEVLLCIQTGKTITDEDRFRFSTDELYFKSPAEMRTAFADCPEAIENSRKIADQCNLDLSFDEHYFPIFELPEGQSLDSVFEQQARAGLEDRLEQVKIHTELTPELEKTYRDRLDMEIKIITQMGFPGYFLIVADFINWSKGQHIPVGPGRGSGAGSLAAYCMKITDIDPITYGLIFERFLNIERKGMPDFDVDFCQERRGEVIEYVQKKYGGDTHVAQIVTYGSMKAKGVIRDVGRALAIPYSDVDKVAKLIPEKLGITLPQAINEEPRLQDLQKRDPQINELLKIAIRLEGLPRHTSTHAAGVVVSPKPMVEYLPVCRGPKGEVLTQFAMKYTEMTGLIKFDFLGLKTLTVIERANRLIEKVLGKRLNISTIPMDDEKTYKLLRKGDALGVFQLESSGMRALLTSMKPEVFTDLIALVALYRPGPLESGMVDDFVNTKHGKMVAKYPLPQLEPILKETYGVIVYQEQVMKIANVLASYSLGDADMLRRAMGKKIKEVMDNEKEKFMAGSKANNVPEDKAEFVFDLMAKFAGYGFNKSHSAAYALIAYQTAYLKAHYPAQFMAALLSCDVNNTDKVVLYINECKDHEIEVLPPDINESDQDFNVIDDRIRFGLAAVKNVGGAALDSIIEERDKEGPYKSLENFCNRIDSRRVNRRVIESLIKAGAYDSFGVKRSQLFTILDQALEQAQSAQRDKQSGQISLFGLLPESDSIKASSIPLPNIPEWDQQELLAAEKETVGFYITGHPLDSYRHDLKEIVDADLATLSTSEDERPVRVGGLVRTLKEHKSKNGDRMAFITLEDLTGSMEIIIFPRTFAECSALLGTNEPIIIQGNLKTADERGAKIIAETVDSISDARKKFTEKAHVILQAENITRPTIEGLKKLFQQFYGDCPVGLTIHFDKRGEVDIEVPPDMTIRPCSELRENIAELISDSHIIFQQKQVELQDGRNKRWVKR
nr:DNA polymerase III subunit alpha [Desulfobulbaceae bacterium]